jgi:hypothetical protein
MRIIVSQLALSSAKQTPSNGTQLKAAIRGNAPAGHYPQTLGEWLERTLEQSNATGQSLETLYVEALVFLERHLRERLNIPAHKEVVVGFDPSRTRPQGARDESTGRARGEAAHGLPDSVALRDLFPEFKGAGSMKVVSLFEDPVRRVSEGWPSIATVTAEYLQDRWCVTSIMLWGGPSTAQGAAQDLFLSEKDSRTLSPRELPAYQNALATDYPAPTIKRVKP